VFTKLDPSVVNEELARLAWRRMEQRRRCSYGIHMLPIELFSESQLAVRWQKRQHQHERCSISDSHEFAAGWVPGNAWSRQAPGNAPWQRRRTRKPLRTVRPVPGMSGTLPTTCQRHAADPPRRNSLDQRRPHMAVLHRRQQL